ncbi:hypothetical protein [Duganella vulcania]|uniref:Uncharacterized protein n=1 Tax=Duganella vulcania TaxID=2692166 RepID=A0A845GGP5_9BURK|nr:hypothetical protein [Duganella vulcania]MYM92592.1 hypothetical protein [Duganella vulcania]
MKAIKVNQTADGKEIFCVDADGKHYEVVGDDVRIVRLVHGCNQQVRMTHPRYSALRARILAACSA